MGKDFGRKRGYYRAIARKEPWALEREKFRESYPIQWLLWWTYHGAHFLLKDSIYSKNPFFEFISKESGAGIYLPVPYK